MEAPRSDPEASHAPTHRDDAHLAVGTRLGSVGVLVLGAAVVARVFYHQGWPMVAGLAAVGISLLTVAALTLQRVLTHLARLPAMTAPARILTTAPRWGVRTRPVMQPTASRPRTPAQILASKNHRVLAEATIAQTSITRWKVLPMPVVGSAILAVAPSGYQPIGWALLVGGLLLVTAVELSRRSAQRDLRELIAQDLRDRQVRKRKR